MKNLYLIVIANVFFSMTAFSQNREIINSENFDNGWGEWTTISMFGDQVWDYNNTFGIGGTPCAKMSGYQGTTYANEDWLISPSMNFNLYSNELFSFYSAMGYPVSITNLTVKISVDYAGGDPGAATWENLSPVLASGNPFWTWTTSGDVDVSGYSGTSVHIAFVYVSDATSCETWEIDDILISGEPLQTANVICEANFDNNWSNWATLSISGDQYWTRNNTFGIGGSPCAKMSGYQGATFVNEDWLISPSINFNNYSNLILTFYSAMCYSASVTNLNVKISTQYVGGDPNLVNWDILTPVLANNNPCWEWTYSGEVDVSQYSGSNVHIAFVYVSDALSCETWEIDDIAIYGTPLQLPDVICEANFDEGWDLWGAVNVTGDQVWSRDNTFGLGETAAANISGYSGAPFINEDWLISPSMNFNNYENEMLTFYSAMCYPVEITNLTVKISTDYQGGNPNMANWATLWPVVAVGNPCWLWTFSEEIDLSRYNGSNVRVAFVYVSNDVECETWEIDNITISGNYIVGLDDAFGSSQMAVYPNPTSDEITVMNPFEEETRFQVFNMSGICLEENFFLPGQNTLLTNHYPGGQYLLVLHSKNAILKHILTKIQK